MSTEKYTGNELKKNGRKSRFGFLCMILTVAALFFAVLAENKKGAVPEKEYSWFVASVKEQLVSDVRIIDSREIRGRIKTANGLYSEFKTVIPYEDAQLLPLLEASGVIVSGGKSSSGFAAILFSLLPWSVLAFFMLMMFRQNTAQNARGMQFGKSKARLFDSGGTKVTFADVAGQTEPKQELEEIIDFLKQPQKFTDLGAKIPKGVLLVGNPGTGKTLLARAVAGEAGVSFLHISGSDFVEMFVGVGASRVRDLFEQGRKLAPSIIFIDEIDAVGRSRGAGMGGGHDEREQTLNQLLVEMDGFDSKEGVIVLAATNRPDVLDAALLRPGRFDRQIAVPLPDIKEREAVLKVHTAKIRLDPQVDLNRFARATPGMSGADLANMVNEAALSAARKNIPSVTAAEFEEARDRILMGIDRKSMVLPEKEKRMTAFHEAGHALPYYFLEHASPLHKVTIIPRGQALGLTIGIPKEDSYTRTKSWLLDQLVIMFGGYAAESVVFGETTTGTQNDLKRATDIARKMVCEWGMSEDIGAVSYGSEDEPIFVGKEIARHKEYSEETAMQIDNAVRRILDMAKDKAVSLLNEHRDMLDKLALSLIEKETLSDAEIRTLLGFEPLASV